jgi:hypothetical protein
MQAWPSRLARVAPLTRGAAAGWLVPRYEAAGQTRAARELGAVPGGARLQAPRAAQTILPERPNPDPAMDAAALVAAPLIHW